MVARHGALLYKLCGPPYHTLFHSLSSSHFPSLLPVEYAWICKAETRLSSIATHPLKRLKSRGIRSTGTGYGAYLGHVRFDYLSVPVSEKVHTWNLLCLKCLPMGVGKGVSHFNSLSTVGRPGRAGGSVDRLPV